MPKPPSVKGIGYPLTLWQDSRGTLVSCDNLAQATGDYWGHDVRSPPPSKNEFFSSEVDFFRLTGIYCLMTDIEKRRAYHRARYKQRRGLFLERAALRRSSMTEEQKTRQAAYQVAWKAEHPSYHAEYLRKYRQTEKGRAVFRGTNLRARQKKTAFIRGRKQSPCFDCGGRFHPEAMEFDHREAEQKTFDISAFGRTVADNVLLAEMEKCDVVCANCHRARTARRRAGLPATLPPPEYEI